MTFEKFIFDEIKGIEWHSKLRAFAKLAIDNVSLKNMFLQRKLFSN